MNNAKTVIQKEIKWKSCIFIILTLLSGITKCFTLNNIQTVDDIQDDVKVTDHEEVINTRNVFKQLAPGQTVRRYSIEISIDGETFEGRAVLNLAFTGTAVDNPIILYAEDLNIRSVDTGYEESNLWPGDFNVYDDGVLEIIPVWYFINMVIIIEYRGTLSTYGQGGLYQGHYDDRSYLAMNLHPTNARRVFPCMDELTASSDITFSIKNSDYTSIVSNSLLQNNGTFQSLRMPPHLLGMVAHNYTEYVIPTPKVQLINYQDSGKQYEEAANIIEYYFNAFNIWTNLNYFDIQQNQADKLTIIALPDVSKQWYSLSIIGIWEPYILIEPEHSVQQRSIGILKTSEALARHWIGYAIYPMDWKHEWIISGLAAYAGWDVFTEHQNDLAESYLDVNALFVTEIIQESLLRDAYIISKPLEPEYNLFDEHIIRNHINGLIKYKASAIMRVFRLAFGDEKQDIIQAATRSLLSNRIYRREVSTMNFIEAVSIALFISGSHLTNAQLREIVNTWTQNTGYPVLQIDLRLQGIIVTQEHFSFNYKTMAPFPVPFTYTTSLNVNFTTENIYPQEIYNTDAPLLINMNLQEDDWVIFNIQGQGYYRTNYDVTLWQRLLAVLQDPEKRDVIHPINRAVLLDDALNLARANRLDYDIAFNLVLTMEHEVDYPAWRAYIRNMDYIRKRVEGAALSNDHMDPDAYLRILRKTIRRFEKEIGFYPNISIAESPMTSLTRGLVMDHACRANYRPCIDAARKWFYINDTELNPDIPQDIRPAVYCAMVNEDGNRVIPLLRSRIWVEKSLYERVVILESLGCSRNESIINTLLVDTIHDSIPYTVEERSRIFKAIAGSHYENVDIVFSFLKWNIETIRNKYGGAEKIEEIIYTLAENLVDTIQTQEFQWWVLSINNGLADSITAGMEAKDLAFENLNWVTNNIDSIYEWFMKIVDETRPDCEDSDDCDSSGSGDNSTDCEDNDDCDSSGSGDNSTDCEDNDDCDSSGSGDNSTDCEDNDDCDSSGSGDNSTDCEDNGDCVSSGSGDNSTDCEDNGDCVSSGSGDNSTDCEDNGDCVSSGSGDNSTDCEDNDDCVSSGSGDNSTDCEDNDDCDSSGSGDNSTDCEDNGDCDSSGSGNEEPLCVAEDSDECGDDAPKFVVSCLLIALCVSITFFV